MHGQYPASPRAAPPDRAYPQDTLFGRSMTPAERLRQHQRSLQKAQRELEREANKLEQQEKKTMMDIKKNAKAGNMVCRDDCSASPSPTLSLFQPTLDILALGNPRKRSHVSGGLQVSVGTPCRSPCLASHA
jgi:hypothetical protein